MASEARLYQFSPETRDLLTRFRLSTSRASTPQARVFSIDKKSYAIAAVDDEVYTRMDDLADALPEHAPRFILLSYPLELRSGRMACPYVMINYMPVTVGAELRMLYAGAKELMRNTAEVGRVLDMVETEEVEGVEGLLKEG